MDADKNILDSLQPAVDRVEKFVRKHPTLSASAATAVITGAVVYSRDVKVAKAFAYKAGVEMGAVTADLQAADIQIGLLRQFIVEKGLREEFVFEFVPSLKDRTQ